MEMNETKMKIKNILPLFMGILLIGTVLLISGCVEKERTVISLEQLKDRINVSEDAFKTSEITVKKVKQFWPDETETIITGRVVSIEFNHGRPDILVFEDGTVKCLFQAERYTWRLGKIHQITVSGREIKDVKILD